MILKRQGLIARRVELHSVRSVENVVVVVVVEASAGRNESLKVGPRLSITPKKIQR